MKKIQWMLAATILSFCGIVLTACSNNDNTTPDITSLTEWQAGKIVSAGTVAAYGGIDKCFADG